MAERFQGDSDVSRRILTGGWNAIEGDLNRERARTFPGGLLRNGKTAQNVNQRLQHRIRGGPGKVRGAKSGNKMTNLNDNKYFGI